MEQPGRMRRPTRGVPVGLELDERLPVHDAEGRERAVATEHLEPDRLLVEPSDPIGVADSQADRPEPGVRREITHPRPCVRGRARRS